MVIIWSQGGGQEEAENFETTWGEFSGIMAVEVFASTEKKGAVDLASTVQGVVTGSGAVQHSFSPYDWNGGTIVSIAGDDYCIIACDTRLSTGYSIKNRNIDRALKLSEKTIVACGGCHADVQALYNHLRYRVAMYKFDHNVDMSTVAAAQLLSNTLYYKRFFPYYALPICAGLDSEGKGYCASYDAVGSYLRSREGYAVNGSATAIALPILDNALGSIGVSSGLAEKPKYSLKEAIEIVKDVFVTVGERDILSGDGVDIYSITSKGIEREYMTLKQD